MSCKNFQASEQMLQILSTPILPVHRILALDFDDTLVGTKSQAKFPQDEHDWVPKFDSVREILQKYHQDKWLIVIFSNQSGVEQGKIAAEVVKNRFQHFIDFVDVPISVFAATGKNHYRKPHTHMWQHMLTTFPSDDLDLDQCVFVGDAAGRQYGKKKDFACSDRKFAHNVGLKFLTPEEFFLGQSPHPTWSFDGFNPDTLLDGTHRSGPKLLVSHHEKEMIILVGAPASGKSTLCAKFPQYVRVNQDTLGTKAKCLKLARDSMRQNKSVIIDATNSQLKTRSEYTKLAFEFGFRVKIIDIQVEKSMAMHLDDMRVELIKSKPISDIVYNIFYKNYRETPPTRDECDELVSINWQPNMEILPPEFFYRY
jgi:bifunctional polynucleotide phosphatase/kinase